MTTPEIIFWSALAILGTVDSAMWSGMETSLYVVSRLRLESRLNDPKTAKSARRLQHEIAEPRRALATLLVMNNLSNYVGTLAVATLLDKGTDLPNWAVTLISVGVVTPVLFVFAETLPKEIFRTRAEVLAYVFAPVLKTVRLVLTALGIVPLILLITGRAERLLGAKPIQPDSGERVRALLQEAEGAGVLSPEQTALLDRATAFGTTTVADEMTPWSTVNKLRDTASVATAATAAIASGQSRLPLIDRRGHTVGIVHTLSILRSRTDPTADLRSLAAPAVTMTHDTPVPKALAMLSQAASAIAIVTQKGRPVGIVTVKDLVEPLTGDLQAW